MTSRTILVRGTLQQLLDQHIQQAGGQEQAGRLSVALDWWREAARMAPVGSLDLALAKSGILRCGGSIEDPPPVVTPSPHEGHKDA